MGKLFRQHHHMQILLLVLLTGMGLMLPNSNAFAADVCLIQGGSLFPSGPKWISQFSDNRGSGQRRHTGIDMGYNAGQTVPQPPGCEILLNSAGGYRFNNQNLPIDDGNKNILRGDNGGYGYQLFYKCGEPGGDQITLRYSHVPQNPITNDGQILQGSSGNARGGASGPHYHFEMVLGDRPIDPECAMYGKKPQFSTNIDGAQAECRVCPPSLPAGPQNLCDKSVRDTLIQHGKVCTTTGKHPNGQTRSVPGGESIDPSRLGPTNGQPDPNENPNTSDVPHTDGDHPSEDLGNPTTGGGFTGNPDDFYPAGDEADPEISPPDPDIPGIPGGAPNLVPKPTPGKEAEEFSGCASDTWTAMVNQAVMETRREDILNKRFIIKPDTVLDYSCFNYHIKKTADEAGPIFSETKHWANLPVDLIGKTVIVARELGSKSLDGALMDIVQSITTDYRRGQFNNPHLAGSTPVGTSSGGKNCDVMSNVWKAAKCKNFDAVDVFYTFKDLRTKEPREFPANMKCGK